MFLSTYKIRESIKNAPPLRIVKFICQNQTNPTIAKIIDRFGTHYGVNNFSDLEDLIGYAVISEKFDILVDMLLEDKDLVYELISFEG